MRLSKRTKALITFYGAVDDWTKGRPPGVGEKTMQQALAAGIIIGRKDKDFRHPREFRLTAKGFALEASR